MTSHDIGSPDRGQRAENDLDALLVDVGAELDRLSAGAHASGRAPHVRPAGGHRRTVGAMAAAVMIVAGFGAVAATRRGSTDDGAPTISPAVPIGSAASPGTAGSPDVLVPVTSSPTEVPSSTAVDLDAANYLITGTDNGACVDPDSPYAAAFGDRTDIGERSDTIMILRVDPTTERAAVLSFPRDLWVEIAGTNRSSRINSAYVEDDPTQLISTLMLNFGVPVDHFIQIDFCAFTTIVDAVGGVTVPFEAPVRDTHTGLYVPTAGCFSFSGDHALAYVRSRYLERFDENGHWVADATSDLGRVSRQQDFVRRVLASISERGLTDPDVARAIIDSIRDDVVVDAGLTLDRMLDLAQVLRDIPPADIAGFQIEATGRTISGNAVLLPAIDTDSMQAVLQIFRGEAPLAGRVSAADTPAATPGPAENPKGIVPDAAASC